MALGISGPSWNQNKGTGVSASDLGYSKTPANSSANLSYGYGGGSPSSSGGGTTGFGSTDPNYQSSTTQASVPPEVQRAIDEARALRDRTEQDRAAQAERQSAINAGSNPDGTTTSSSNPFSPTSLYDLQRGWNDAAYGRGVAGVGAHGGVLDAQGRYLNSQYGFTDAEGNIKLRGADMDREYIDKSKLNIDQLKSLYGEQKANEILGLTQRADVNRREINSDATANGTWLFPGRNQKLGDVDKDLAQATQSRELSYRDKLLSLDNRGNELDNRRSKLDLIAEEVGLDKAKAKAALDFGMAQLGYDKFLDSNKLLDMLDSNNQQNFDLVYKLVSEAMKNGQAWDSGAVGDQVKKYTGGT